MLKRETSLTMATLTILGCLCTEHFAQSQSRAGAKPPGNSATSPSKAIEIIRPSVVQILMNVSYRIVGSNMPVSQRIVLGSGCFADTSGRVFTANHVIEEFHSAPEQIRQLLEKANQSLVPDSLKTELRVGLALTNEERNSWTLFGNFVNEQAKEIRTDAMGDAALIEIAPNPFLINVGAAFNIGGKKSVIVPKVPRFDPSRPIDGEMISVSGFPLQIPSVVTNTGFIATAWFSDEKGKVAYLGDLQVNHGNSGGPVYRVRDGVVIGLAQGYRNAQPSDANSGLAMIIPIQRALDLLK